MIWFFICQLFTAVEEVEPEISSPEPDIVLSSPEPELNVSSPGSLPWSEKEEEPPVNSQLTHPVNPQKQVEQGTLHSLFQECNVSDPVFVMDVMFVFSFSSD